MPPWIWMPRLPTVRAASLAVHLGDGNGGRCVRRVFFERPSGVVHGGTGAFGFQIHVGALVLDGLKHSDGLAELFSGLGVFDGDDRECAACRRPVRRRDAAVAMSKARGRFVLEPISSAGVLLNSTT